MVWGIDIGVRSCHAAAVSGSGKLQVFTFTARKNSDRFHELREVANWTQALTEKGDAIYIEEPPLAGSRNLRVFLHLAQISGVIASAAKPPSHFVEVSTWKKHTVGHGNATKDDVRGWLEREYPLYAGACGGDQNLIDATCIALYGQMDISGLDSVA